MEINSNTHLSLDYTRFNYDSDRQEVKTAEQDQRPGRADSVSLNLEINTSTYDRNGKVEGTGQGNPSQSVTYQSIRIEIQKQSFALLLNQNKEDSKESPLQKLLAFASELMGTNKDPLGLGAYFSANPGDLEKVQQGIIPDYFNVENTGRRILDLWTGGIESSENVDQSVENAKAMINQAYDEISDMLGGLPQIVEDTRNWIMEQLDAYTQDQGPMASMIG